MLKVHGGPRQNGTWMRVQAIVTSQIERLLTHLKLQGEFLLTAVEPRKGGTEQQGLRVQSYDPDTVRPAVLFVAQPGDNRTCWLWRLQLPKGTDPHLVFGHMQIAVEEGWHVDDAPLTVVPDTELVASNDGEGGGQEGGNKEEGVQAVTPPNCALILADQEYLFRLLVAVARLIEGRSTRTTTMHQAIGEIVDEVHKDFPRREAGRILEAFDNRGWVIRDRQGRTIEFTDEALLLLSEQGFPMSKDEGVPQCEVVPVVEASAPADLPKPVVNVRDHLKELTAKARRYAEARKKSEAINRQLEEYEATVARLREELETATQVLEDHRVAYAAEQRILEDADLLAAMAELEACLQVLKEAES